jgi:hypothetical protein
MVMSIGETMSLNCSQQEAVANLPGDIWAWRTIMEWYQQVKTTDPSTSLVILPAESSGSETGESWRKMAVTFAYEVSLFISLGFFNMP